ncbi:MAG: hypothetical protein M3416_01365 [Acidobacteriota bacterium]|nr:hypothetical protein [Acidobacteriota bacterium]
MLEVNVLAGPFVEPGDYELLFGPLAGGEQVLRYDAAPKTLGTILRDAGIFPSRAAAKSNGRDLPLPAGFSDFTGGKGKARKWRVTVWNPSYGLCPTCAPGKDPGCQCTWSGESCDCRNAACVAGERKVA